MVELSRAAREQGIMAIRSPNFAPVHIVGVGRWLREDDQAGLLAARTLRRLRLPGVNVMLTESPAADLAGVMEQCERLIVIDGAAASTAFPLGQWRRLEMPRELGRIRQHECGDCHGLGVATALGVADALGVLPPMATVYVIAVASVGYGTKVGAAVKRSIRDVIREIHEALSRPAGAHLEGEYRRAAMLHDKEGCHA